MTTAARRPSPSTRPADAAGPAKSPPVLPPGTRFAAELHLAELDERHRPGGIWTGRAVDISRSHLTLRSRRMCYKGRPLIVIVHLVDDRPVALFGAVRECDYDGDGLYKTLLELRAMPDDPALAAWIRGRDARGTLFPSPP